MDGREHHEASRGRALLGSVFYFEGHGARRGVLGKFTNIKHNTPSKRLVVRDLVLSAFRAIQWLMKRPLFMNSTEVNLALRARVDVESLTEQSRVHLNKGKQTNERVSAMLLANAPRECDVCAVPHRVPDQYDLLSRDWLGRHILLMLRPVLACLHSHVLRSIGHLAFPGLEHNFQRAYYRLGICDAAHGHHVCSVRYVATGRALPPQLLVI